MGPSRGDRVVYRWPRARLVRPLGVVLVGLGAAWVVVLGILALTGRADASVPVLVLILVSLVVGLLVAGLLARPPAVLELDGDGYRLRHLRGGGRQAGPWSEVVTVSTDHSASGRVLVFHGTGDVRSVVPLVLLGARADEALGEVRARLNTAYGYRKL